MNKHEVLLPLLADKETKSGTCWHCEQYVEAWLIDDEWTKWGIIRRQYSSMSLNNYCKAKRKAIPDLSAIRSWREMSRWPEAIALRKELAEKYDKAFKERFRIDEKEMNDR